MLEELYDAVVILFFLKCRGDWEGFSVTGRRQIFGTSSKKARRRIWKYELVSLTSISRQIVNMEDVKVTVNRRWEKKLVEHLGSQDSGQQIEAKLSASYDWHTLGLKLSCKVFNNFINNPATGMNWTLSKFEGLQVGGRVSSLYTGGQACHLSGPGSAGKMGQQEPYRVPQGQMKSWGRTIPCTVTGRLAGYPTALPKRLWGSC